MPYTTLYAALFIYVTIVFLLSALLFAIMGALLKNTVTEISLFAGPKLITFRMLDVDYYVRLFPIGSYVKFSNRITQLPSYVQILFHMLNPIGLFLISIIAIGVNETINHTTASIQMIVSILSGGTSIRPLFSDLFNTLASCTIRQGIAYAAIGVAIMMLLPLPGSAAGKSLMATIDPIYSMSLKSLERLLLIDFLIHMLIIIIFAYYLFSHPFV